MFQLNVYSIQNLHRYEILKLSSKILYSDKIENAVTPFLNKKDLDKLASSQTYSQKLCSRQNALTIDQALSLRNRSFLKHFNFVFKNYLDFMKNRSKGSSDHFHHHFLDRYFLGYSVFYL